MQITLITIGTLKESYLKEAFQEYAKRISAYGDFKEVNLPEVRIVDENQPKQIEEALLKESEKILSAIPKDAYVVALCVEGKQCTSEELAKLFSRVEGESGKLVFVIGSSYGLHEHVKQKADYRLSISKLTFPHQLIRVLFSESIYRSLTILKGKKYHK